MASYTCAVRTNYFHVKNEEKFRAFAEKLYCNEGDIEVWEDKDKAGKTVFGFGCCSSFCGIHSDSADAENPDEAYDSFVEEIQKLIAEDDAVIIFEIGREKLNYLNGIATVITNKEQKHLDISDFAVEEAKKCLETKSGKLTQTIKE